MCLGVHSCSCGLSLATKKKKKKKIVYNMDILRQTASLAPSYKFYISYLTKVKYSS